MIPATPRTPADLARRTEAARWERARQNDKGDENRLTRGNSQTNNRFPSTKGKPK